MMVARLVLVLGSLIIGQWHTVHAQPIAVPAWMQPCFAPGSTTDPPEVVRGPIRQNTFIGSYTVKLTIWDEGIAQVLYLTNWQDSTRGMVLVQMVPGIPHTSYLADLEANKAVIANAMERKTVIGDLSMVVLVDHLREPGRTVQFPDLPAIPTGNTRELAGIICQELLLVERTDTMHLWRSDLNPSPFIDTPAWLPMNVGPLKVFRLLFRLGDRAVMKFTLPNYLDMEIVDLTIGATPPPVLDLTTYTVTEESTLQRPTDKP